MEPTEPVELDPSQPLPLTGERTTPGVPEENYWFQRHVAAYRMATNLVHARRVLDAGCGEGYGTAMLASTARKVIGVDIDRNVVGRATVRYPMASFEAANLMEIPYPSESFGAVVSLQVIEHLSTPDDFIAECARLVEPGGIVVIATPNRLTFSPDGIRNPFHTIEYAPAELEAAMKRAFADVEMRGVFHGRRMATLDVVLRKPFTERLIEQPAAEWPRWLRAAVARVRSDDFVIRDAGLDRCLDLIAIART